MAARGAPLGNDNAVKGLVWRSALDRAIKQDDGKRLRTAAEKLLDEAAKGEAWAVKELADRLDGKAPQSVQLEGGETPILTKAVVELIHARSDSEAPTR